MKTKRNFEYRDDSARDLTIGWAGLAAGLALLAAMVGATGCGGMEIGGRLGVYRVDERQESQRMVQNPNPWVCTLWPSMEGCKPTEMHGS